jgi:hypothetical protein
MLTAPVVYCISIYFFGLCSDEKEIVCAAFAKLVRAFKRTHKSFLGRFFPKRLASSLYYDTFAKHIDWNEPKDLNEKINWLKFYGDTSMWSALADKYAVRKYVSEKGFADTLVRLYGVWKSVDEIDWDALPEKFILKVNNGSGDALICRDKSTFDKASAAERLDKALNLRFGVKSAEPHYLRIPPRILAEELLDAAKQNFVSTSLVDYKIWCFDGKPECILVVANRAAKTMEVMTYDTEWNAHPEYSVHSEHYALMNKEIPCPHNLQYMLQIASALSEGHPQMRVDLYEVDGKVYFGELTLTSACGLMEYFTPEFLLYLGQKVKL